MAHDVTLMGATYPDVPSIVVPSGNGTASFTDVTDTTATAADVASGKQFYTAAGVLTQGTSSGGGGSMNAQVAQSTTRAASASSTYMEVISLTCSKAGTYDVYWTTFRTSSSGTWGSQLYLGTTAYGTAETGNWSHGIQNIHLTGVSISASQEVSVRVRTRGSSYYGYVGTLTIIQKS